MLYTFLQQVSEGFPDKNPSVKDSFQRILVQLIEYRSWEALK